MEGPKAARQSAATEVSILTEEVASRAKNVALRLGEITEAFCEEQCPQSPSEKIDKAVRTLPPYFSDLRSGLWNIDNSLSAIENIISRMDI